MQVLRASAVAAPFFSVAGHSPLSTLAVAATVLQAGASGDAPEVSSGARELTPLRIGIARDRG